MKQHFNDYRFLYMFLAMFLLLIFIGVYDQNKSRLQHGQIEKLWGCEFIKFHQGNNNFQYIHNPKCPNCAGNK